jgi:2-polyprenyl-6-methoxyphenol hydroxylase-like FAD-dependent oxidoreductase
LAEYGFEVSVVERAPAPRTEGYMIDFWGLGYEVAERMGVLGDLRALGYLIDEIRLVKADGGRLATIGAQTVRRAMGDRFFSLMRGDLAGELHRQVANRADIRFDEAVRSLDQRDGGVDVEFEHAAAARFDLVFGADGVHSTCRGMLFPEPCEIPLGLWTASFAAEAYPHRDSGAYVSFTEVGRQVARYALRGDRSAFFFVFREPKGKSAPPRGLAQQKFCLRTVFGGAWECPDIFERLDAQPELYFDSVDQVRAPAWSSGRVALVGDAAACPSLLAGEGASLAMAGAYVLAGELSRHGDDRRGAFERYERLLRPAVEKKQKGALGLAGWFAPRTALGLRMRNGLSRLAATPGFSALLIGDMLASGVKLPDYARSS